MARVQHLVSQTRICLATNGHSAADAATKDNGHKRTQRTQRENFFSLCSLSSFVAKICAICVAHLSFPIRVGSCSFMVSVVALVHTKNRLDVTEKIKDARQRRPTEVLVGRCCRNAQIFPVLCLRSHPRPSASSAFIRGSNCVLQHHPCSTRNRWWISSSISSGLETVWAIASRNNSP